MQENYNELNNNISTTVNNSIIYTTSSSNYPTFNIGRQIKGIICSVFLSIDNEYSISYVAPIVFIPQISTGNNVYCTTGKSSDNSLRPAVAIRINYTVSSTSFKINSFSNIDKTNYTVTNSTAQCIIFTFWQNFKFSIFATYF